MHISLDAALQRQPLLSTVGDKLLPSFPGAAAAYSLRPLNGDGNDVIRVRRDGDSDGTTNERDFTGIEVNTELADWVNGKQETTLPVDLTKVGDGSNAYFSNPESSYYDCGTFSVGAGETWEAEVEMAILSFGSYNLPFGYNAFAGGYGLIIYSTGTLRAFSNGAVLTAQPSGVTEGQLFTAKYGYDGSNVFVDINGNRVYTSAANTQTGASNVPLSLGGGSTLTDNPCIIKSAKLTVNGTLIRNYTNITPASTITDATGTQDATVSGSLSDIKTADEATTAAAYSLRKVRSTYTGDAVRIRRASDDVEVNVAFDTNGDVSASSAITNVTESPDQGDTTATTLGGFLTESVNTYVSDYSAGLDGWTTTGSGTLDGNIDGIGGRDDNLRFTSTNADINVLSYHRKNTVLELGQKYNVTFDFYIPSSNAKLDQIDKINIGGQEIDLSSFTALDQWVSVSATNTTGATQNFIIILWEDSSELGDATGDVAYIRNVSVNAVGHNAHVHTWYDQSANSNHATQDVAGNQPKIAEAGALLADGLDFDGVDDYLKTSTTLSFTQPVTGFSVSQTDITATSQGVWTLAANDTTSGEIVSFFRNDTGFAINAGATLTTAGSLSYSAGVNYLKTGVYNTTSSAIFVNGTSHATGTVGTNNPSGLLYVGRMNVGATALYLNGVIKELVIYDSDQSTNRFKIESNINNYYGIYTASHNGFVPIWYDQSGNGINATNATLLNQPQIVTNGVLETASDNGLPALVIERSNVASRGLDLDSTISTSANLSSFLVGSDRQYTRWLSNTTGRTTTLVGGSWDGVVLSGGANDGEALAQTLNLTNALFSMTKVGTTGTYHRNGSLRVTGTCGSTISISSMQAFPSGNMGRNSLQEAIIYLTDQSANRTGIESNIADKYGITLP